MADNQHKKTAEVALRQFQKLVDDNMARPGSLSLNTRIEMISLVTIHNVFKELAKEHEHAK